MGMLAGYPPFYDEDPLGIYQKILEGKVKFPWHFDRHSKDLCEKLLTADLTKRLGNLKGGAEDVKKRQCGQTSRTRLTPRTLTTTPTLPKVARSRLMRRTRPSSRTFRGGAVACTSASVPQG